MTLRDYQTQAVADLRAALIYKATNTVNGKIYIGQTVQRLYERIGDHRRKAIVHESRSHFHAGIRKYGFEAFTWEVVEFVARDLLNERERYWIAFYDSANPAKGYNNTKGGDTYEFTEETRRRIGAAGRGKKRSVEYRENLRRISRGEGNPFHGRRHTEEAKAKNRAAHVGRKLAPEHIAKCIHLGSKNCRAEIDEATAQKIKEAIRNGRRQCEIVKELGVSKNVVQGIRRGITWRHV